MNRFQALAWLAIGGMGLGCPAGDATDGPSPIVRISSTADCLVLSGGFPSGFEALPGRPDEAVAIQFAPLAVVGVDLETQPPTPLATDPIPPLPEIAGVLCPGLRLDSDSNGVADDDENRSLGLFCFGPQAGTVHPITADLVAVTTSSFEQVLFADPQNGELRSVQLDPPPAGAGFDPDDWPLWPAAGVRPFQTGVSSRVCIDGTGGFDSLGDPLPVETRCDPGRQGYFTSFTADAVTAADRLFVASSNLLRAGRGQFAPGTVLVYDFDRSADPPTVAPLAAGAVQFTTGYNPTSLTAYTTPSGRELVLVGVTGALTGDGRLLTESSIDVIDAASAELIASIPLGLAGLGFDGLVVDATNRLALIGAVSDRALFAIDLAALDDPTLGLGPEPLPILLDGMTPGFPDARVHHAGNPFPLPKRADGPLDTICIPQTTVDIRDDNGFAAASEFCDGTLTRIALDLPALRTTPLDPDTVLVVDTLIEALAPNTPGAITELRIPSDVRIRPGTPGIDYDGPDVHFTFGDPEGGVCGLRVDAL